MVRTQLWKHTPQTHLLWRPPSTCLRAASFPSIGTHSWLLGATPKCWRASAQPPSLFVFEVVQPAAALASGTAFAIATCTTTRHRHRHRSISERTDGVGEPMCQPTGASLGRCCRPRAPSSTQPAALRSYTFLNSMAHPRTKTPVDALFVSKYLHTSQQGVARISYRASRAPFAAPHLCSARAA